TYCDELEQAQANLSEAEQLFDPAWPPGLCMTLHNTRGWLRSAQGRSDESAVSYKELLDVANAWGDQRGVVVALVNLEQHAAASGRLEDSVARGRELLQRLQQNPSLRGGNEHFVATNLTISLTRLGRVEQALEVGRTAFALCEKAGRLIDLLEQS